jgi:hypothetical protein
MSGHVVVPVEACRLSGSNVVDQSDCVWVHPFDRCQGCRNDGTRARFDRAMPVERCWPAASRMWAELESEDEA